ncbi:MAG: hypothetical protein U1C46_01155 [Bacteroidales bacterium]|nr:hypothetical protein [Bacteroidales bacterium]
MQKETLTPPFSNNNRSLNSSLHTFDLPTLIETMKHNPIWAEGNLDTMVLLNSRNKQIILTALHDGTEINSFQSNNSITFKIIEGKLKFHTLKESVTLEKGQLMTLHENINYSLTNEKETILLLIIAKGAIQPVVMGK